MSLYHALDCRPRTNRSLHHLQLEPQLPPTPRPSSLHPLHPQLCRIPRPETRPPTRPLHPRPDRPLQPSIAHRPPPPLHPSSLSSALTNFLSARILHLQPRHLPKI